MMILTARQIDPRGRAQPCAEFATAATGANRIGLVSLSLLPLSLMLTHCGEAPSPGALAANAAVTSDDTFDERFPAPQFRDRFPTDRESFAAEVAV